MSKLHAALVALLIVVVGAIVIVALTLTGKNKEQDRFSVTGSGTVYAKADIANINIGVKTGTKNTAVDATKESSNKMNQIISTLKGLGIDEKDIRTSDYNLNPVYNWTQDRGQELTGYEVSQTVSVKIRDLDKIGDVIAQTTSLGANQIGDISFTIDDETALKDQARAMAIDDAKKKAALVAKQSGMKLGSIKDVSEGSQPVPTPLYAAARADSAAGAKENVTPPTIQTGQNEIKVDVTLTYEVK